MGKVARNEDGSIMTVQNIRTRSCPAVDCKAQEKFGDRVSQEIPVLVAGRSIEPKFPLA